MNTSKHAPESPPGESLTVGEIARFYNCHPSSVTRQILRGVRLRNGERLRLPARRHPGGWRLSRADYEAYVDTLTADRLGKPTPTPIETTRARERHLASVDSQLRAAGI